ncbi:putative leucine-rich repeat-containing protein DDB_G0290503 [Cardiocondyla obscurior]
MQPTYNAQPSPETLHKARRLESFHDVLETYRDASWTLERQKSADRIDETGSFITYSIMDVSSEYFQLNPSEGSLSSLADYSSYTSKTYQGSKENLTMQSANSKEFKHRVPSTSINDNLSDFATTEPHLRFADSVLRTSEDYQEYKNQNSFDGRDHELESHAEASKNKIKTDIYFNTNNKNAMSREKILYILPPEDKNIENETLRKKRFPTKKKFTDEFDKKQYRENVISQDSSRSKFSNDSGEDETMALLLREALHFKNVLLTQSKQQKCSMSDVIKWDNVASELLPSNDFPAMIIDVKDDTSIISSPRDQVNQRYICLEMKQRRDAFPRALKEINTFRENERDTENRDYIPKTSSEYFSITDVAIQNNTEMENNVTLSPPVYEKIISITIPVSTKNQVKPNINERSIPAKTFVPNIQAHANLENNLRENTASNIDNANDRRSSVFLKLEDLILEHVKNIRDYMDTFLRSQNTAILKKRKTLRSKCETHQCSNETSRVAMYNLSTTSSTCNSTDQIINSSKMSSDLSTHVWPNYIREYKQKTDSTLECSSDVCLKRNPGMFALATPIESKFSSKNDTQQSEISTRLEKEDSDLSFATHSCKSNTKSVHKVMPRCEKYIASNLVNNKTDKETTVDNETLNIDSSSINNFQDNRLKNNKTFVHTASLSPRTERYFTVKPLQVHPQIKAKSDVSLITGKNKDSRVDLCPKKSPSFLMCRNTVEQPNRALPYTKFHNDKNKYMKNKLRLVSQSKSLMSSRKICTKSCIPIFKNRLELLHRNQTQVRSSVRYPLTMLWEEKRNHTTDENDMQNNNVSINKYSHAENLTKLNSDNNPFDKKSKSVTCKKTDVSRSLSELLSNDQNVEFLAIDKEHSDKINICDDKSDTNIIQHIKKIASREVVVISIMANDSLLQKYPADLFILNTKNINPTDLLIHKNKLWTITADKTEKEVTAKPSIADTCTSMSAL